MRPVLPGEILNEEFLKPLGLTANALGAPPNRITAILKDERGITGDAAIRLRTFFRTSAEFWMNLQITYDLRNAEKALPARLRKSIESNRSVLARCAKPTTKPLMCESLVEILAGEMRKASLLLGLTLKMP